MKVLSGHGDPGPGRVGTGARRPLALLAGLLEPIVIVLLLIAFFTSISGKPLDGLLMLLAGASLAWDTGWRARQRTLAPPAGAELGDAASGEAAFVPPAGGTAAGWAGSARRPVPVAVGVAGGIAYAAIVGSFARYSWPATIAVVAVGAGAVLIGWHGPVRIRPEPGRLPVLGTSLWGGVLVGGSLWELWALLHQPTLTTSSYAHPTISTLTDPLLATAPGRSLVLTAWLALGWYLVER